MAYYGALLEIIASQKSSTTPEQRRRFAAYAFHVSSHYDSDIFNYFNHGEQIPAFKQSVEKSYPLRYGENPHQEATFYGDLDSLFEKLNGKEISYNNMLDIDAALNLIADFCDTTFAILKHNNACGLASRDTLLEAWEAALAGDPLSAFGGVLVTNRRITEVEATEINNLFFEVILAPAYTPDALAILRSKKNRIILRIKEHQPAKRSVRTLLGGVAIQDADTQVGGVNTTPEVATKRQATETELKDMIFANKIVKHSKSNAIVLAKDGVMLASGVGQTSRVDALRHAITKAQTHGFDLQGAVMASDAFFPFADCVEIAHAAGITSVIQPGGSLRDQESIDFCNNNNIAMVITSLRHFKH